MSGPPDATPLVFRESRRHAAWKLGLSLLLSLLCFGLAPRLEGHAQFFAWAFFAFGAFGVLVGAWTPVRPGCLVIDDTGVTETRVARRSRWLWREIGPVRLEPVFVVMTVAFDDLRPKGRNGLWRRWLRHEGIEGGFMGGWTMPLEPLAQLLEARRRAAVGESPLASGEPPR